MPANFDLIQEIANADVEELMEAEKSYGDSWKQRGGVGAFMMLARKWDRIENQVRLMRYDIFKVISEQGVEMGNAGIIDDIRDLRRYLMLVEGEMCRRDLNGELNNPIFEECNVMDRDLNIGVTTGEATSAYVNQDGPVLAPKRPVDYTP